jgi:hypothetical protein
VPDCFTTKRNTKLLCQFKDLKGAINDLRGQIVKLLCQFKDLKGAINDLRGQIAKLLCQIR